MTGVSLRTQALGLAGLLILALFIAFGIQTLGYGLSSLASALIIIGQISLPLFLLEKAGLHPRALGIYAYRLETCLDRWWGVRKAKPDWEGVKKELIFTSIFSFAVFLPYSLLYAGFFYLRGLGSGLSLTFNVSWPPELPLLVLSQLFLVALPEEFFYRGFLQGVLVKSGLGTLGAVCLTNAIFALSHLAAVPSPERLLTFFPGLLFSYLVIKRGNLLPAIVFHALSNILSQWLYYSIILR